MHWNFHFDGKHTPIQNDAAQLSLLQSISTDDICDGLVPDNVPVTDSSDDSSISRTNTHNVKGNVPRQRFFYRKFSSSNDSNNSNYCDKSESSASSHGDEHVKVHTLFHLHVPSWKNIKIKKPQRTTSFNSLSSIDVSDAETAHIDETKEPHTDNNPVGEDQVPVRVFPSARTVHFSTVQIREYDLILGDHPYCSNGVPTQLGWIHVERTAINLDRYECMRGPRRKSASQFRISATARKDLLTNSENDYTKADFRRAERKLYKDRSKKHTQKFFNMS